MARGNSPMGLTWEVLLRRRGVFAVEVTNEGDRYYPPSLAGPMNLVYEKGSRRRDDGRLSSWVPLIRWLKDDGELKIKWGSGTLPVSPTARCSEVQVRFLRSMYYSRQWTKECPFILLDRAMTQTNPWLKVIAYTRSIISRPADWPFFGLQGAWMAGAECTT